MSLPYFAADTLGVTLYVTPNGLKASEVHEIPFGPWKIDLSIDVTSDIVSGSEMGLWVTLGGTLRVYLVIRDTVSWLLVLNTKKLQECGLQTMFAGHTVAERITEIKPAVHGVFRWSGDRWSSVQYDGSVLGDECSLLSGRNQLQSKL